MANNIVIENLYIDYLLKNGSISDVYKGIGKKQDGDIDIVVKYYKSDRISHQQKEVKYLSVLNHENIVKLIGVTESALPNLIMEFAECGSLHSYLYGGQNVRFISGFEKLNWMLQCAKGLAYLHERDSQIFHCNLNSRHLLLFHDYNILKICGFDDVIESRPKNVYDNTFREKADIYSFGIIIWETMIAKLSRTYDYQIKNRNENRPILEDEDRDVIASIIKLCCNNSPFERAKMKGLVNIIDSIYIRIGQLVPKLVYKDLILKDEDIGFGAFGFIHRASWKSMHGLKHIVVKKSKDPAKDKDIEKEYDNMLTLNHKNIVTLYGATKDPQFRTYIAMEYAECGCLSNLLHRNRRNIEITQLQKFNWMIQCAKGIKYLHDLKPAILHRDLKPSNLLLFDNYEKLKICDFGTVRPLASQMTAGVGTYYYMSPEVGRAEKYTEKCDIYSFAIVMWEIISMKLPYYHLDDREPLILMQKIIQGTRPRISDITDRYLSKFITLSWDNDPSCRPTIKNLCDILKLSRNSFIYQELPMLGAITLNI